MGRCGPVRLWRSGLPRHGDRKRFGTVTTRTRGRIPERRQRADGTVDLDAQSANEYVLGIEAQSPLLTAGEHELYLEVKRIPRLRVDVLVVPTADGALSGTITAIESLGDHTVEVAR